VPCRLTPILRPPRAPAGGPADGEEAEHRTPEREGHDSRDDQVVGDPVEGVRIPARLDALTEETPREHRPQASTPHPKNVRNGARSSAALRRKSSPGRGGVARPGPAGAGVSRRRSAIAIIVAANARAARTTGTPRSESGHTSVPEPHTLSLQSAHTVMPVCAIAPASTNVTSNSAPSPSQPAWRTRSSAVLGLPNLARGPVTPEQPIAGGMGLSRSRPWTELARTVLAGDRSRRPGWDRLPVEESTQRILSRLPRPRCIPDAPPQHANPLGASSRPGRTISSSALYPIEAIDLPCSPTPRRRSPCLPRSLGV
jgi:hypothetical protein